jgi:hypothetical protein
VAWPAVDGIPAAAKSGGFLGAVLASKGGTAPASISVVESGELRHVRRQSIFGHSCFHLYEFPLLPLLRCLIFVHSTYLVVVN